MATCLSNIAPHDFLSVHNFKRCDTCGRGRNSPVHKRMDRAPSLRTPAPPPDEGFFRPAPAPKALNHVAFKSLKHADTTNLKVWCITCKDLLPNDHTCTRAPSPAELVPVYCRTCNSHQLPHHDCKPPCPLCHKATRNCACPLPLLQAGAICTQSPLFNYALLARAERIERTPTTRPNPKAPPPQTTLDSDPNLTTPAPVHSLLPSLEAKLHLTTPAPRVYASTKTQTSPPPPPSPPRSLVSTVTQTPPLPPAPHRNHLKRNLTRLTTTTKKP